jgi:glycine cleavage system regulatory protein
MATLVLTVMGDDRPGLVDALAGVVEEHGGNWEQSRMAHLARKFAGILLVSVPDEQAAALHAALDALQTGGVLHVIVERGGEPQAPGHRRLSLELLGQDRAGIVHDIAHALAERGVSIEELETGTRSASMGGGTLFHAEATLLAPENVPVHELELALEALANELMVNIELAQD